MRAAHLCVSPQRRRAAPTTLRQPPQKHVSCARGRRRRGFAWGGEEEGKGSGGACNPDSQRRSSAAASHGSQLTAARVKKQKQKKSRKARRSGGEECAMIRKERATCEAVLRGVAVRHEGGGAAVGVEEIASRGHVGIAHDCDGGRLRAYGLRGTRVELMPVSLLYVFRLCRSREWKRKREPRLFRGGPTPSTSPVLGAVAGIYPPST